MCSIILVNPVYVYIYEALRVIRANGKIDDFFSLIYVKVEVKTFQKQYTKIHVVN